MTLRCRRMKQWVIWCLGVVCLAGLCAARTAGQGTDQNPAPPAQISTRPVQENYERLPFMTQSPEETAREAPSAAGLLLRTIGALCLIVGLIAATAWAMRRFGGAQFGKPAEEAPELAVLATISLGERRSLAAVRFGERLLLIGATAQSVTLLAAEKRPPRNVTPRMRSVADLLHEDDSESFEQALDLASQRLTRQATRPEAGKETL